MAGKLANLKALKEISPSAPVELPDPKAPVVVEREVVIERVAETPAPVRKPPTDWQQLGIKLTPEEKERYEEALHTWRPRRPKHNEFLMMLLDFWLEHRDERG